MAPMHTSDGRQDAVEANAVPDAAATAVKQRPASTREWFHRAAPSETTRRELLVLGLARTSEVGGGGESGGGEAWGLCSLSAAGPLASPLLPMRLLPCCRHASSSRKPQGTARATPNMATSRACRIAPPMT
jgi:hypothetical protein